MLTVETVSDTLRDRLEMSQEILEIAAALASMEQQHGRTAATEQIRSRLRQVQLVVFAQLRALLDACEPDSAVTTGRIH